MKQFKDRLPGEPYLLVAASVGRKNIILPDGYVTSCSDVKKKLGYPQLLAWKNDGKEVQYWVDFIRSNPSTECKLIIDSSAYSAWTRGLEVDIDEYIEFINSISDVVYWFAELDKIPGKFGEDHTPDEFIEASETSWKNYLYMLERVNCPKKILPIFHQGEDIKYLYNMLNYRFEDGSTIEYIGISPDNGVSVNEKFKWYEYVWSIISHSSNPYVKTHNFGCTSSCVINNYPSMSSDSISWLKQAVTGYIYVLNNGTLKSYYASNRNINKPDHILNTSPDTQEIVNRICAEIGHGMTLSEIVYKDSEAYREIFNLYVLDMWRRQLPNVICECTKNNLW